MRNETKLIKNFIKNIGVQNVKVQFHNGQVFADMIDYRIFLSNAYLSKDNKLEVEYRKNIADFYKSKGYDIKVSMTTFTIFHELGHLLSRVEYQGPKNLRIAYGMYMRAIKLLSIKQLDNKNHLFEYRNIKLERLADKYGYEIYKKFENQAIEFDKQLIEFVR